MKATIVALSAHMLLTTSALSMSAKARRAANVPGNLFVDESCIDCDTCRWMAPNTYGRAGAKSFVHRQPQDEMEERAAAYAAVVACPTGSIRLESPDPAMKTAVQSFPLPIHSSIPRVFHLGFHCAASFGATPYLLCTPEGVNVMIDAPRFTTRLAKQLDALGGLHILLLTHMDDVVLPKGSTLESLEFAQSILSAKWSGMFLKKGMFPPQPYLTLGDAWRCGAVLMSVLTLTQGAPRALFWKPLFLL